MTDIAESLKEEAARFVALCRELREMGAIDVQCHGMRAVFPSPTAGKQQPSGPNVVRIPLGAPREKEPAMRVDEPFPRQPGDTDDDVKRRQWMASVVDSMATPMGG